MRRWDRIMTGMRRLGAGIDSVLRRLDWMSIRLARIERAQSENKPVRTTVYRFCDHHAIIDEWANREQQEKAIQVALARKLAETLLEAGVIEITVQDDADILPGGPRALRNVSKLYMAKITVVIPEGEERT